MDEAASLSEKVPTAFLQAMESDTFDILLQCVEQVREGKGGGEAEERTGESGDRLVIT